MKKKNKKSKIAYVSRFIENVTKTLQKYYKNITNSIDN